MADVMGPCEGCGRIGAYAEMRTWFNHQRGKVLVVEPTGADTYLVVETVAGRVTVRTAPQLSIQPGDNVRLAVKGEHASWFDASSGERVQYGY